MIVPPRRFGTRGPIEPDGLAIASATSLSNIEIESFDLDALKELRDLVGNRIHSLEQERRHAALAAVEKIAADQGLTDEDLRIHFGGSRRSAGSPPLNPPKYHDPKTGKTWGGIGRKPNWIKEFEASGGDVEELAI